jgi:hypothetical protein
MDVIKGGNGKETAFALIKGKHFKKFWRSYINTWTCSDDFGIAGFIKILKYRTSSVRNNTGINRLRNHKEEYEL